jgi:hypothetical protein
LFPSFELDRGICCLCKFMMTRAIPFDLPSVYRSCHGKDASMVGAWPMPTPSLGDCSGMLICLLDFFYVLRKLYILLPLHPVLI